MWCSGTFFSKIPKLAIEIITIKRVDVGFSKIDEKTTYTRNSMLNGLVAPPDEFKISEIKIISNTNSNKREYSFEEIFLLILKKKFEIGIVIMKIKTELYIFRSRPKKSEKQQTVKANASRDHLKLISQLFERIGSNVKICFLLNSYANLFFYRNEINKSMI
jgi:hypothetical protein